MHVVVVHFETLPAHSQAFLNRVMQQAKDSLSLEAGCLVFDVCMNEDSPNKIFLYEIYSSAAEFEVHLNSNHYQTFAAETAAWVIDKQVSIYSKIIDNSL